MDKSLNKNYLQIQTKTNIIMGKTLLILYEKCFLMSHLHKMVGSTYIYMINIIYMRFKFLMLHEKKKISIHT